LENLDWKIDIATDIVNKQYGLFSWVDAKTSALITANSLLLAAVGFSLENCLSLFYSLIFLILSFILVGLSLFYCLRQVIPQKSSGKGVAVKPNLKALSGILKHESWQEYHDKLSLLKKEEYLSFLSRQIYGMATSVEKSRNRTTTGVKCTMVSIFFLMASMIGMHFEKNELKSNKDLLPSIHKTQKIIINKPLEKASDSLNFD